LEENNIFMKGENLNLDSIKQKSRPVLEKHNVKRAKLFGSYARGEQGEESDIDLIVEMRDGTTLIGLAELKKDLEKELNVKVDVLTQNSLLPEIRSQIQDEAVEI